MHPPPPPPPIPHTSQAVCAVPVGVLGTAMVTASQGSGAAFSDAALAGLVEWVGSWSGEVARDDVDPTARGMAESVQRLQANAAGEALRSLAQNPGAHALLDRGVLQLPVGVSAASLPGPGMPSPVTVQEIVMPAPS